MRGTTTITADQIASWQREADELEDRLLRLKAKIHAGTVLLADEAEVGAVIAAHPLAPKSASNVVPIRQKPGRPKADNDPNNLSAAIKRLANESPVPIKRPDLRARLIDAGFPKARVNGNYFYTALQKLVDREYISLNDGLVWKGRVK